MKKIFLLHNFPTPYRNHLFESLNKEANKREIYFEVQFFSEYDDDHPNWRFKPSELYYNHKFWKPQFKTGSIMHLNIDMLKYIYNEKPDLIIMGGIWTSINTMLISLFSNFRLISWDETNRFDNNSLQQLSKDHKDNLLITELEQCHFNPKPHIKFRTFKKYLLRKIDFYACPGNESINFYGDLFTSKQFKSKSFIYFPNLIDEKLFHLDIVEKLSIKNIKQDFEIPDNLKIAYWPARLVPAKGIINFLSNINNQLLNGWRIIIVGSGPMKSEIIAFISSKKLNDYVTLLDVLPYDKARLFYAISDVFILPSLSDSNPLSIIEAIHSSLPILISKRVGNLNEVLNEGINGISIDPLDRQSMNNGIKIMFTKSKNELKEMGRKSLEIANMNYDTNKVITNFFDEIILKYRLI